MKFKICSFNVNGVQQPGEFARLISKCSQWTEKGIAQVWEIQEHNLNPAREKELKRIARSKNFELVIAFADHATNGVFWGGTLTLIALKSATLIQRKIHDKGALETIIDWSGMKLSLLNCYTPAKPLERINFINKISKLLDSKKIASGDWNCVPDVTLDVQSKNPLAYRNIGGQLLEQKMALAGMVDIRRIQLEEEREPTRTGTRNGDATATRLDRHYVPTHDSFNDIQWTISTHPELVFQKTESDHWAIILELENTTGEMGHDRKLIKESLVFKEYIQDEIIRISKKEHNGNNRGPIRNWTNANDKIVTYLLAETKKARAKEKVEIKQKIAVLKVMKLQLKDKKTQDKAPNSRLVLAIKKEQRALYELENPEQKPLLSKSQSVNCFQKSDMCTRAMFKPYKAIAKQNWINKLKKAEWKEGEDPNFQGHTSTVKDVSQEFTKYYKMLLSEKKVCKKELKKALKLLGKKKILNKSRDDLEKEFTLKEVVAVMESLPLGKAPGPNGMPNAVYKCLSKHFAPKFTQFINAMRDNENAPKHMLQGEICQLYKKNERDDPRNYRPITLLNTDYKMYTRILSRRMRQVVHEFISESQKGFMPRELIQDCTMLLHLTEAYINEEPDERKGIFVFFDMEKAFDRVSYKFLNQALEATGFGPKFRKSVHQFYNVDNAPQRRILTNGFYSDFFSIKSGVAQGDPLSPLLFLLVAEALKLTIAADKRVKGIKIGNQRHLLSQFADDTTLMLASLKGYKPALQAVKRWGKATGMKENLSKREGLALGKYRSKTLPRDTKWIGEGNWAKSLGNPVGNDLDHNKFWAKKIQAVRDKAQNWVNLYKASYAGRNLIVQAMYFGSIRYWLYTLKMDKELKNKIQADADVLWWKPEPDLNNPPARIKRWVAKGTVIGDKNRGGLGNMDWKTHSEGFTSEWFIRYVHPSKAAWKDILDYMLFANKEGEISPERQTLLYSKLTPSQKLKLLHRLPKTAIYIRQCLRDLWDLKLVPTTDLNKRTIASESLWYNHSFEMSGVGWRDKKYFQEITEVNLVSDIMDKNTNRPFTKTQWKYWISKMHQAKRGRRPDNLFVITKADLIFSAIESVPRDIKKRARLRDYVPKVEEIIALGKDNDEIEYGYYIEVPAPSIRKIWIDSSGYPHDTGVLKPTGNKTILEVEMWRSKWKENRIMGPKLTAFPANTEWKIGNEFVKLDRLTIKVSTKARQNAKMKPPSSEISWKQRLLQQNIPFRKVWRLKPKYASQRDTITWLKLKHRNLYVPSRDPSLLDQTCKSCNRARESMHHLATCSEICDAFWQEIHSLMDNLKIKNSKTDMFRLLGVTGENQTTCSEGAAILAIAWRCLYAETVGSRIDGRSPKWDNTLKRAVAMIIGRVTAYGEKWREWYLKQRHNFKSKIIAEKYRSFKLITKDEHGNYEIHKTLSDFFDGL